MDSQSRAPGLSRSSAVRNEAVQNLLATGMFKVDFEPVALDFGDRAIAKLAVEHALAKRQIGAASVAETDRRCARFDHPLRLGLKLPRDALCQPGPRVLARIDCAAPRCAKGSAVPTIVRATDSHRPSSSSLPRGGPWGVRRRIAMELSCSTARRCGDWQRAGSCICAGRA